MPIAIGEECCCVMLFELCHHNLCELHGVCSSMTQVSQLHFDAGFSLLNELHRILQYRNE